MIVMQDLGRKNSRQIRCNRELGVSIDKCDVLASLCHADWMVRARKRLDDVEPVPECAKEFLATIKQKTVIPCYVPGYFAIRINEDCYVSFCTGTSERKLTIATFVQHRGMDFPQMTYLGRWWGFELHNGKDYAPFTPCIGVGAPKKNRMYDVWTRWGWVIFEELSVVLIEK